MGWKPILRNPPQPSRPPRVQHTMPRPLRILFLLLLLGLATTVAVSWLCAAVVDLSQAALTTSGGSDWSVTVARSAGAVRITSNRRAASWSPSQATGAPDTPNPGDYASAWAPGPSNGS